MTKQIWLMCFPITLYLFTLGFLISLCTSSEMTSLWALGTCGMGAKLDILLEVDRDETACRRRLVFATAAVKLARIFCCVSSFCKYYNSLTRIDTFIPFIYTKQYNKLWEPQKKKDYKRIFSPLPCYVRERWWYCRWL